MSQAAHLRSQAEGLATGLPPLLADAKHLASTVLLGAHGRRRSGMGDEFWQYRPFGTGDEPRMIDWRRSARSDTHFIKQKEWQAAQSVMIWVDAAQSLDFTGDKGRGSKRERARLLGLAMAVLLIRAGERVGLSNMHQPPRSGDVQLLRMTAALAEMAEGAEYGVPDTAILPPQSRAVFLSDFLGDPAPIEAALTKAADRGVQGALCQILDPVEESFPFSGRTIFDSVGGGMSHETLQAAELKARYLERLAERKDFLDRLCRATGWQYHCHHTGGAAQAALLWLYAATERAH